jgi:hypothetical protein
LDLGDSKYYRSNYSEEERQLDMNNPISQLIARDDDGKYLALNGKRAGYHRGHRTSRLGITRQPTECPVCCGTQARCKHKESYIYAPLMLTNASARSCYNGRRTT